MEEDDGPIIASLIKQAPGLFDFSIFEVTDIDDRASAIMSSFCFVVTPPFNV